MKKNKIEEKLEYVSAQIHTLFEDNPFYSEEDEISFSFLKKHKAASLAQIHLLNKEIGLNDSKTLVIGTKLTLPPFDSVPILARFIQVHLPKICPDLSFIVMLENFQDGDGYTPLQAREFKKKWKLSLRKFLSERVYTEHKNLIILNKKTRIEEIGILLSLYLCRHDIVTKNQHRQRKKKFGRSKYLEPMYYFFKKLFKDLLDSLPEADHLKVLEKLVYTHYLPNGPGSFRQHAVKLIKTISIKGMDRGGVFAGEGKDIGIFAAQELESEKNKQWRSETLRNILGSEVPRSTLYSWACKGRLNVVKNSDGYYDWDTVDAAQLTEIVEESKNFGLTSLMAKHFSKQANISFESARGKVRRWRVKGLSDKEIYQRILETKKPRKERTRRKKARLKVVV